MKTLSGVGLVRGAVFLPALLALSCHSSSGTRDANQVGDVAGPADSQARDSQAEIAIDAADTSFPLDSQADIASGLNQDADGGLDAPLPGDAGPDGATVFQCKFPVANPKVLFCDRGQYCLAVAGGPVGSGTTFSCTEPQATCSGNLTCECLCAKGSVSNCSIPAYPSSHCTCILNEDGLSLLCALP
jgi:hypothetical protein